MGFVILLFNDVLFVVNSVACSRCCLRGFVLAFECCLICSVGYLLLFDLFSIGFGLVVYFVIVRLTVVCG